jgi:hypothetical protein
MNAQQPFTHSWQYLMTWKYGFLVVLLLLLVWNLWDLTRRLHSQAPGRFSNLIVSLMLIFNHFSEHYVPPGRLKTAAQFFTCAWVVFGCAYVFTNGFSRGKWWKSSA